MPDHNYIKTKRGIIDLVDLKQHVDLTAMYGSQKLRCLWHDDNTTPNLQVYSDHAYCFACGKAVDAISFVMAMEGLNFYDAVAFLQEHKLDKPISKEVNNEPVNIGEIHNANFTLHMAEASAARKYLMDRGIIDTSLWRDLLLGYDFSSILIPHIVNGVCVNVKFRNITGNGPKYNSLPGREFKYLYPYDYFRSHFSNSKVLFLCEGEFDAMILLQAGLPAMSVPAGVNTPLDSHMMFFKKFEKVYLLFDQDEAGQHAVDKVLFNKLSYGVSLADACAPTKFCRVCWNDGKDVTEAREVLVPELLKLND